MIEITSKKLEVGDWFRTKPVFRGLNKNGNIVGISHLCYVKSIKTREKNKQNVKINVWTLTDNKVKKGGMFSEGQIIYLLDKEEMLPFKKQIILLNLK